MSKLESVVATWTQVHSPTLEAIDPAGHAVIAKQRDEWLDLVQADAILDLFAASAAHPAFGYETTMFEHGLRAATRALHDGLPESTVVAILLHDIGYALNVPRHGELAALLLGPFISAADQWMLRHHQIFVDVHAPDAPGSKPHGREAYRSHPHFEWTARFCDRYDNAAIAAAYAALPLDDFVPMVRRVLKVRQS